MQRLSTLSTQPTRLSMTYLRVLTLCCVIAVMLINTPTAFAEKVNINKADASALMTLKGIGEKRAKAIIQYRKKNGNFSSTKDLLSVPGIGPEILKGMQKNLSTSGGLATAPASSKKDSKKTKKSTKADSKSKSKNKDKKSTAKAKDSKKKSSKSATKNKSKDKKKASSSSKKSKSKSKSKDNKKSKKKKNST